MSDHLHLKRRPRGAGDEVDAFCTKCGLELAHIIVAMDGAKIARVQCNTCKGHHAYRSQAPEPKAAKKPKTGGSRAANIAESDYDKVMHGRDLARAKSYRPANRYEEDDVLNHVTFGIGAVTKLLSDDKIEVVFRAGIKVLVHGRT